MQCARIIRPRLLWSVKIVKKGERVWASAPGQVVDERSAKRRDNLGSVFFSQELGLLYNQPRGHFSRLHRRGLYNEGRFQG